MPSEARPATAEPGRPRFGRLLGPGGAPIDHGYLVIFPPDRAFTRETTAEFWAHGSPAALRAIVEAAVEAGARPATPGEFTMRAFLHGRIDATQAEAIRDLIEARTAFQARVAHVQAMGAIGAAIDALKNRLVEVAARLEAAIEFAEEPDATRFVPRGGLAGELAAVREAIGRLAASYDRGRILRDGAAVAIVGAPNAGKSSIFNMLVGNERAIVTPVAGTTRDTIEEGLDIGGVPVRLLDTAGLHAAREVADIEAVRRSRAAIDNADLLLVVIDRSRPIDAEEDALLGQTAARRRIVVVNKTDLPDGSGGAAIRIARVCGAIAVSARDGSGIEDLRRRLAELLGGTIGSPGAAPGFAHGAHPGVAHGAESGIAHEEAIITSLRQRDLLQRAAAAIGTAEDAARSGAGEECWLLDLREAIDRLGEITGAVTIDDLYRKIFSTFCIGK